MGTSLLDRLERLFLCAPRFLRGRTGSIHHRGTEVHGGTTRRSGHRWLLALAAFSSTPSLAADGDCPDRLRRLEILDQAEQSLVEADLAATDLALRELERALSCGPVVEAELLGRWWLVEAATLTLLGDTDAAGDSWRAAARVAPGRWVDDFGDRLRLAYEQATADPPTGAATVALDPPVFRWIGAIDGEVATFPATVSPGLHLVQVGPDQDHVVFSRWLVAVAATPAVVLTGLVEATDRDDPPVVETGPPAPDRFPVAVASLYAGIGADLAFGRTVARKGLTEPAVKLLLPFQTGVVVRPSPPDEIQTWLRLTIDAGPLVGGTYLHTDTYGRTSTPAAIGTQLAGGAASGRTDMGLLVGYQWPDRIPIRGVVASRMTKLPVQIEGRLGLNAAFTRNPEPAFDLVFAAIPALFR